MEYQSSFFRLYLNSYYLFFPLYIDAMTPSPNPEISYLLIVNLYSSIPKTPQKLLNAGENTNFVLLGVVKHRRITLIGKYTLPS